MITAEAVLRAYQRYDLYREWQSTLAARQAALFATPHRLDYALQVVSLLAVDKKRLFTQRCAQDKATLLAGLEAVTANQADPLDYLERLYADTYAQTQAQERALLRPVSRTQYWQAQLCLLFITQPSYQLGAYAAQSVLETVSQAKDVAILNASLSPQEQALLQQLVGVSYVVMTLVMSGLMHYSYELASTLSRSLLNHLSPLFYLGQPLNRVTDGVAQQVGAWLPKTWQPTWHQLVDRCRWDEVGVIEKEPLLAFALNLSIHVLLSRHPNKKVIGLTYSVVLAFIHLVTIALRPWLSQANQDTHHYTDTEINDLLLQASQHSQITLCLTAMLGTCTQRGNDLVENLNAFHQRRRADIIEGLRVKNQVLIPVNTHHNHWILFQLTYHRHASQPHQIAFFDPLGNPLPEDLHEALRQAGLPEAQPLQTADNTPIPAVQDDAYHCGTWIVEVANILIAQHHAQLSQLAQVDIAQARRAHMQRLYPKHNPHAHSTAWLPVALHMVLYIALYSRVFHYLQAYFPHDADQQETEAFTQASALDTLGLFANATHQEIRRAYHHLAKQYHPDKNPGNETAAREAFVPVAKAYDYLRTIRQGR